MSQFTDPFFLAVFAAIALPILALISAFSSKPQMSDRLQNRAKGSAAKPTTDEASNASAARIDVRKEMPTSKFGALGQFVDSQAGRLTSLNLKLLQSGVQSNAGDVLLFSLILGIVLLFLINALFNLGVFLSFIGAATLAMAIPWMLLGAKVKKRQKQFINDLPDALDLVVRGIRSGLPVTDAIESIATEFTGPTREVFESVQSKIAIGQTLEQALWTTAIQMPLPEFRFFIISLTIQQETGGNLGEILQKLSAIIRKRQQLKLKIKAMSSEARASAMIIGSLPFVMMAILYLVNSSYIMTLFTDPRGTILLGVGATMLSIGVFLMAKMSKFEI